MQGKFEKRIEGNILILTNKKNNEGGLLTSTKRYFFLLDAIFETHDEAIIKASSSAIKRAFELITIRDVVKNTEIISIKPFRREFMGKETVSVEIKLRKKLPMAGGK